jgi:hypothetical protein
VVTIDRSNAKRVQKKKLEQTARSSKQSEKVHAQDQNKRHGKKMPHRPTKQTLKCRNNKRKHRKGAGMASIESKKTLHSGGDNRKK